MLLNLTVDVIQTMVDPRIKRAERMAIQSPSLELGSALVQLTVASARALLAVVGRRLRRGPVTLICAGILILIVARRWPRRGSGWPIPTRPR
jgi:hypothetical protein